MALLSAVQRAQCKARGLRSSDQKNRGRSWADVTRGKSANETGARRGDERCETADLRLDIVCLQDFASHTGR
jgi:hypothetical protein